MSRKVKIPHGVLAAPPLNPQDSTKKTRTDLDKLFKQGAFHEKYNRGIDKFVVSDTQAQILINGQLDDPSESKSAVRNQITNIIASLSDTAHVRKKKQTDEIFNIQLKSLDKLDDGEQKTLSISKKEFFYIPKKDKGSPSPPPPTTPPPPASFQNYQKPTTAIIKKNGFKELALILFHHKLELKKQSWSTYLGSFNPKKWGSPESWGQDTIVDNLEMDKNTMMDITKILVWYVIKCVGIPYKEQKTYHMDPPYPNSESWYRYITTHDLGEEGTTNVISLIGLYCRKMIYVVKMYLTTKRTKSDIVKAISQLVKSINYIFKNIHIEGNHIIELDDSTNLFVDPIEKSTGTKTFKALYVNEHEGPNEKTHPSQTLTYYQRIISHIEEGMNISPQGEIKRVEKALPARGESGTASSSEDSE